MLVSVLASGSKGNSVFIETNDLKLLIDIGTNNKYITSKLDELGVQSSEIDYVLITHTHKDHVSALETFIKKNKPNILLSESMYNDLDMLKTYPNINFSTHKIKIGNTMIDFFKTSHDTNDSRGYIVTDENSSLVYLTDTGYLNQKYFDKLYNKDIYIMEANHDVEMLINGRYPKWLKSRILSDKGHLSNNAAGFYLSKLIGPNTKKVILAHLSHENNTEKLAMDTVKSILEEYDIKFKNIEVAKQTEKTEVVKL